MNAYQTANHFQKYRTSVKLLQPFIKPTASTVYQKRVAALGGNQHKAPNTRGTY
jgi:hypothetical protein